MAASRAGSAAKPEISDASRSEVNSVCGIRIAPSTLASTPALANWSWSIAPGSGARIEGRPIAASADAVHVLVADLLGQHQAAPQRMLQPLDRARHDIGHDARALAAADDEQAQ